MKAIIWTKYGQPEVLQLADIDKPTPKNNEILIKVFATAVNSADWRLRKPDPAAVRLVFGLTKPGKPILGIVFSGVVEAAGNKVTRFKAGDQIFGSKGMKLGTYAEYTCQPEDGVIAIKPANISHIEAASIPFGAMTALHFLRKANVKQGQKVLIYGASGAVGTAVVQLAKYFGAEVTGICSTVNIELVKSLGADKVIDYTKDHFSKHGEIYDVIFETVDKLSYSDCINSLGKNGVLLLGAAGPSQMVKGVWTSLTTKRKVISGVASEKAEDLNLIKELIEKGLFRAVVDRVYPLEQIAEAHRYAELGHKRGNVAISVVDG